jgi:hypothetical protein
VTDAHVEPSPRCREPRCPCQTSPLWRDRTPDEDAESIVWKLENTGDAQ